MWRKGRSSELERNLRQIDWKRWLRGTIGRFKKSSVLYVFAFFAIAFFLLIRVRRKSIHSPSNIPNDRTLLPLKYQPLPLGSILPTPGSWLEKELKNSANGLAGNLAEFYAFVVDSKWVNGTESRGEYSGLHEGFPYWFNGLVSLAYSLPDGQTKDRLKAQVHWGVNNVLSNKQIDGWLGPETAADRDRMLWGRFPLLLGLMSLIEANPTDYEKQVMPALEKFVSLAHDMLKDGGKGFVPPVIRSHHVEQNYSWGRVRVADFVLVLQWMLERNPSPSVSEVTMLWETMEMAYAQSLKWEAWYNKKIFITEDLYRIPKQITVPLYAYLHGVNIAQGLKAPHVMHRMTHNVSLIQTGFDAVDWTLRYHGAASGTILADERINGLSPWTGSEFCTTVELIFSLSNIYSAQGRNKDADRAERAAYNALPTMLTPDHWAHQYMTQPNQPWSKTLDRSPFFDANAAAQTFGLEPHYPCCTVNHHQGLPKFLAGSWLRVGKDGLAHIFLSPGTVQYDMVKIECRTQYPFANTFSYTIDARKAFTLYLRVPEWAKSNQIVQDGRGAVKKILSLDKRRNFRRVKFDAGHSKITFTLDADIRVENRANNTVAVHHGALLYALEVEVESQSIYPPMAYNQTALPTDYAPLQSKNFVMTNGSAWNIAIDQHQLKFCYKEGKMLPDPIWAANAPPTYILARGCRIDWPLFKKVTPGAPLPLKDRHCLNSETEVVRLVPLGSAKLHMAEIPTIAGLAKVDLSCSL